MDLTIDSRVTDPRIDTRWRASKHGQDNGQPGTLDLDKFVDGVHYNIGSRSDNVIPSGVAVQFNESTGLFEPWNAAVHVPADAWAADTDYALGDRAKLTGGVVLVVTTAGKSHASNQPTAPGAVGDTVTDGTVVWTREADPLPYDSFINDDAGIDLYRRTGVAKSTKAMFSRFLHGIIEVSRLPIAAQAAAVKDAPSTGSYTFI